MLSGASVYPANRLITRLALNNVKPKDWYFVVDLVRFRTGLGLTNQHLNLGHIIDTEVIG